MLTIFLLTCFVLKLSKNKACQATSLQQLSLVHFPLLCSRRQMMPLFFCHGSLFFLLSFFFLKHLKSLKLSLQVETCQLTINLIIFFLIAKSKPLTIILTISNSSIRVKHLLLTN